MVDRKDGCSSVRQGRSAASVHRVAESQSMPVPDYQTLMLPSLEAARDGGEHPIQSLIEDVANRLNLTVEDRKELLPSGRVPLYINRIHWAVTYLAKAGLLTRPRRAVIQITDEGRRVLGSPPRRIDLKFLEQYDTFREFRSHKESGTGTRGSAGGTHAGGIGGAEPPEETLARAWLTLHEVTAEGIIERLKGCTPRRFEEIVVELLVKMGYGGSYGDAAASVVGQPGDQGIDGVIKEDRLGLDNVYIQAKRWQAAVHRPDVMGFVGSLEGKKARKGVMITTSSFSTGAQEYAASIEKKVVLVDGPQLAELMIEHHVGVAPLQTYTVDRIDEDFFGELLAAD
jgi:restriction system protein